MTIKEFMSLPQVKNDQRLRDEALGLAIKQEQTRAICKIKTIEFVVNYKTSVSLAIQISFD